VTWLWIVLGLGLVLLLAAAGYIRYLEQKFRPFVVRIFQEKPLFIVPRGQPVADAEEVRFRTADGLTLCGCYLRTPVRRRRGVILFGLEFGSNRWACVPYCEHLRASGIDIFAFEFRGQGDSDDPPGYEPMQWVTDYEVRDVESALAYLKGRADADPRGVGFFGISKGGGAGLLAAARDPYVRCCVTDGIFATYTTMVPYMRKWVSIYSDNFWIQHVVPTWVYGLVGRAAMWQTMRERHCRFPHLEWAIARLAPRPLLMIHGGADTYIKPEMARALFARARPPKELWIVPGAKHNQALQVAGDLYRRRVLDFFAAHLEAAPGPRLAGPVRGRRAVGSGR
jgi:pimeloyl-ACP methyl ester carboxylesterase